MIPVAPAAAGTRASIVSLAVAPIVVGPHGRSLPPRFSAAIDFSKLNQAYFFKDELFRCCEVHTSWNAV